MCEHKNWLTRKSCNNESIHIAVFNENDNTCSRFTTKVCSECLKEVKTMENFSSSTPITFTMIDSCSKCKDTTFHKTRKVKYDSNLSKYIYLGKCECGDIHII